MQRLLFQVVFATVIFSQFSGCVAPPLESQITPISAEAANAPRSANHAQSATANLLTPEEQMLASLPSRGQAPDLANEIWFNSAPLKLTDLRGKVVLIKFWTFG